MGSFAVAPQAYPVLWKCPLLSCGIWWTRMQPSKGREGILQGQCGKPITETQKKMHVQTQVQQDSVWKWIQNGAVIGCLEEEREHLEVTHTPVSLPPSFPDTPSWSALSPFTPTAWERCGPGDTWGRERVVGGADSATSVRVGLTWTNWCQFCRHLETGLTDGLSRGRRGGVIEGHLET